MTFEVPPELVDRYRTVVREQDLDVSKALRRHMRKTVAAAERDAA